MRKRRLAAVFLLVNATLLPNSLVFADTVLSNVQTTETSALSEDESAPSQSSLSGENSYQNLEDSSSAVENFTPPKISGNPSLQGANGRFEQMKPDKIHLSASKQTKESFIQQQSTHSYIDAQGVYEIVSTDVQLPDGQWVDKGTIQLVIPTEPTEQVTNYLAYYVAKKIKTYSLPLEKSADFLMFDDSITLDKEHFLSSVRAYYSEVSADPIIQTHITHISMTETYMTLNETDIYPTFYRQEEHQKISGPALITDKVALSDQTTWVHIQTANYEGWVAANSVTAHKPKTVPVEASQGQLSESTVASLSLDQAWLEQSEETISHSESYHVQRAVQISDQVFYVLTAKDSSIVFVPQKEFQPEGSVSAETDSSNEQIGTAESTASDSKETTDSSFQPQNKVPQTDESTLRTARPSITYSTHVKNRGWLPNVSSGQLSGTTGQSLQVEAFRIHLSSSLSGAIEYTSYVQGSGWQNWVANGAISGTTGQVKQIEGINIRLTGQLAATYNVYYRVHVRNFGWLPWTMNGNPSGTLGYGHQIEAIEIQLLDKNSSGPATNGISYIEKEPSVLANTHVTNRGWLGQTDAANQAGTTGQRLSLQAMQLRLSENTIGGGITYQSHIANKGWETNWAQNGTISGTTGQNRSLQAFSFQLTGELAENYDIYYRAFVRSRGWLGWASNGQKAGSVRMNLPVEGIQLTIVENDRRPSGYQPNQLTILGQVNDQTPQGRFINSVSQSANRIAPAHGLYTSVMLAQAILETGYGTSYLAQHANNFFGMKFKDGEDEGKYGYIWHISNEVINGVVVPVNSKFRVYQSTDQSFLDNALKLRYGVSWDPNRYAGTWKVNARSYRDATRALTGTYATDPDYGQKLNNLIEYWKLDQFD
ncbi:glucosaminidase domain-containing protein [Enterococcus faecium]|nr:glucosaminidase domain-containing protein [Enterococcus faecium]MCO5427077.1 glucosaminidase domain-containing protein [Enterococcus faecium]MCO5521218.1 glucosaminidase domain-containing protein [Enterococcus faecium]